MIKTKSLERDECTAKVIVRAASAKFAVLLVEDATLDPLHKARRDLHKAFVHELVILLFSSCMLQVRTMLRMLSPAHQDDHPMILPASNDGCACKVSTFSSELLLLHHFRLLLFPPRRHFPREL
jgi:hypothetical protein